MKTQLFISSIGPGELLLLSLCFLLIFLSRNKSTYTRRFWYLLNCFKRDDRADYWLFFIIFSSIIGGLASYLKQLSEESYGILSMEIFITWFAIILSSYLLIAAGCRRCHDLGVSGIYQFIPFYFLVLLCKPGKEGNNKYGDTLSKPESITTHQYDEIETHITDDINNINHQSSTQTIEVKSTDTKQSTKSKFTRLKEFILLKNGTFKSVLNEGQRRICLLAIPILSLFIGFIGGVFTGDDGEINEEYFYTCTFIGPFITYIGLLLFIWVQEGRGNVRSGGNAMGTLWNYLKLLFVIFLIPYLILIIFIVFIPNYYERKSKVIFNEYYNYRYNKNWDGLRAIYGENISVTDLYNDQSERDIFTKEELIKEHKENNYFVIINNIDPNKLRAYNFDHAFDRNGICKGEVDLTFENKETGHTEQYIISTKLSLSDGKINEIERKLLNSKIL